MSFKLGCKLGCKLAPTIPAQIRSWDTSIADERMDENIRQLSYVKILVLPARPAGLPCEYVKVGFGPVRNEI